MRSLLAPLVSVAAIAALACLSGCTEPAGDGVSAPAGPNGTAREARQEIHDETTKASQRNR